MKFICQSLQNIFLKNLQCANTLEMKVPSNLKYHDLPKHFLNFSYLCQLQKI